MKADCKEAFTYLGAALQKEAPDAAVPKFKCALELDPQYKPALLGMGSAQEARGTLTTAVTYYQQALGERSRCWVPARVAGCLYGCQSLGAVAASFTQFGACCRG